MNKSNFKNANVEIETIAHEEHGQKLLMIKVRAVETVDSRQDPPINVSIVIDRSGSMSGPKLTVAKDAAERLIRSLRQIDRVGVVAYDDRSKTICELSTPSDHLAHRVSLIEPGGRTNLYDGWLDGARLLSSGGRVILLSDGQANDGRYQDAHTLAIQAEISYRKFGVTTSTIGIGEDYDEGLMAAMARTGQGMHYYAQTADSIMDAFARERFLMGTLSLSDISLTVGSATIPLGRLLSGEQKVAIVPINQIISNATLSFVDATTDQRHVIKFPMPNEFAVDHTVTAYHLIEKAAKLSERTIDVRDRNSALNVLELTRALLLELLNHPLAEEPLLQSLGKSLRASMDRLGQLAEEYDERFASQTRKRSLQVSQNLREPSLAFNMVCADNDLGVELRRSAYQDSSALRVDPKAFDLRPLAFWLDHLAVPTEVLSDAVRVALVDPMDGFAVSALERELKLRVLTTKKSYSVEEIGQVLLSRKNGLRQRQFKNNVPNLFGS